ncbi:hypothetical protein [Planomicrobium sp. YIM 101495]|uniref:hypothetical protein n=1 Tax=Planomicrobium sp. YIM 101495 TaxID=2665160 RepID=UPI0018AA68FD|nr:hypothetical protein [Planomicrobium sp. YIM 101495]
MSQLFDTLKEKIRNADMGEAKEIITQVKRAYDDGKIDENEKNELMDLAKSKLGGLF